MFWKHNRNSIIWTLLILVLCGIPGDNFSETQGFTGIDKWIHAFLFGMQAILLSVGLLKQSTYPYLHRFAVRIATIFTLSYGVIIEVMQGTIFVERSIQLNDMLANLLGTILGLIAFYLIYGRPFPLLRSRNWW